MTVLNICQIPEFSKDYKNVADFETESNRTNWFLPRVKIFLESNVKMDNFTASVVINRQMDNILRSCDYLFADTSDGSKKLFFFIDNMEQLTASTSKLYLTLDVWQTYLFDIQLKPSYVVRQHVPRWDENGYPTKEIEPEPVALGSYVVSGQPFARYGNFEGAYLYTTSAPVGMITKEATGTDGEIPTPPSGGGGNPSEGTITTHDCIDGKGNKWLFPVGGIISSIYPNYPDGTYHGAVDISGNNLQPIYPPEDGFTVYRSGWNTGGYGNLCILHHTATDTYHYFAHQNELPLVNEGQTVNHTDCIGYVGTTGNSTGPHLHWEIRDSDLSTKINPCVSPTLTVGMTIARGQGGY